MASRRATLLHSQLSAIARQCEVAHTRWAIAAAGSVAWQTPAQLHAVQQHALQIAAESVAAQRCSWTASRGFAADAAPVADADEGAVELEFTEAAVEVRFSVVIKHASTPAVQQPHLANGTRLALLLHLWMALHTKGPQPVASTRTSLHGWTQASVRRIVHMRDFLQPPHLVSASFASAKSVWRQVQRLGELAADTPGQPLVLRLTVEGGGCSGFTYHFVLDQEPAPDDR
jgi:hypothetical protein